jgi:hypothetical protein
MKPTTAFALSLLSAGLALSLPSALADDASNAPPAPPQAPATPPAPDSSQADGQAPPPPHRRRMHPAFVLGELTAKLNLSAEQQKTVGALIVSNDTQLRDLRADDSVAREDKRAKMAAIIEATRAQIRAALTPDQQKIFDTLPTRGEHGGKGGAAPTPTPVPTT